MKITVNRYKHDDDATLGNLSLDGRAYCKTLEDQPQFGPKVQDETRIPAGTYKVGLRDAGGMTAKYRARFPDIHRGMLHILDVPGFVWVYIHIGNTDDHTAGCILVGYTCDETHMTIGQSAHAYEGLYKDVVDAAAAGDLEIEIIDGDL